MEESKKMIVSNNTLDIIFQQKGRKIPEYQKVLHEIIKTE